MKTQIAQALNVQENQILDVREWAYVYWVKVAGRRPTLVSKKVVEVSREDLLKSLLDEFNSRLDWEDQFDCDVNTGMPLLTGGSYKQVNWACSLRYKQVTNWTTLAEEFPEMLAEYSDEQLTKIFRDLLWRSDAIWWINNREKHLAELV